MKTRGPTSTAFSLAALGLALAALVRCGGATERSATGSDGGTSDAAPAVRCMGSSSEPVDRPQHVSCPATTVPYDAGGVTCTSVADCPPSPQAVDYLQGCLQGRCTLDECFTDSDCPTPGQVCGCAAQFQPRHGTVAFNQCMTGECQVNTDCASEHCSPSISSGCGGLGGYYCRSPADTCTTAADCCSDASEPACVYQPGLGRFACDTIACPPG